MGDPRINTNAWTLRFSTISLVILAACAAEPRAPWTPDHPPEVGDDTAEPVEDTEVPDDPITDPPEVEAQALDLPTVDGANILLIQVDTLRADHLVQYGGQRQTMPNLAARPWLVVDGLVATSSWTATSTASMLTSSTVIHHGVLSVNPEQQGPESDGTVYGEFTGRTWAEHLSSSGYATALFSGNDFVSPTSGLSRGFEDVRMVPRRDRASNAEAMVAPVMDWLDNRVEGRPFFVMLQPMDAHAAYSPVLEDRGVWADYDNLQFDVDVTEEVQNDQIGVLIERPGAARHAELRQQLTDVYDEQLLALDRALERIFVELEHRGMLDNTLVVFTADHGESLGETEEWWVGHGKSFRPEVLHVPLMMMHPSLAPSRMNCLASNVDLMPTAAAAVGAPPMSTPSGRVLQNGCRDQVWASYSTANNVADVATFDTTRMATRDCVAGQEFWYDLSDDPLGANPRPFSELASNDPLLVALRTRIVEYEDRFRGHSCHR